MATLHRLKQTRILARDESGNTYALVLATGKWHKMRGDAVKNQGCCFSNTPCSKHKKQ